MECQQHATMADDVKDHEVRIRVLEKDNTENRGKIDTLCKTMDKIEGNTTWILRLVVSIIIVALMGLLIKGV